jgi:hypothetical protein
MCTTRSMPGAVFRLPAKSDLRCKNWSMGVKNSRLVIQGIFAFFVAMAVLLFSACAPSSDLPASYPTLDTEGLPAETAQALRSLARVDDYSLYTMSIRAQTSFSLPANLASHPQVRDNTPPWGCSLFAALGDKENLFFGRNFDWDYSPALLLFYYPSDGFASVSMVDLTYFLDEDTLSKDLTRQPLENLIYLLDTPTLPFDGMNEKGVTIGMAAVPDGKMTSDPAKETIGSIQVIREILDHAASVDEAVVIFNRYNIDMGGGPPIHYLITDASGSAVLVEFSAGKMEILPNTQPWHVATNFLVSASSSSPEGQCGRYDAIQEQMRESNGILDTQTSLDLLSRVHQTNTQWSVIYNSSTGDVIVVMGGQYQQAHTFSLEPQ